MIIGRFIHEPREALYRDLLTALAPMAERALLVRKAYGTSRDGDKVLEQLSPGWLLSEQRSEWPGTKLMSSTEEVNEYSVGPELTEILRTAVSGLYEWQAPFPEDLALLRADHSVVLYTVGHEEEGGLSLYPAERDALMREYPGINGCIEWDE
jgi:hypothetical protein